MDIALFILSGLGIILGYVGAFVPGLSGPPIAWLGLLCLYFVPNTNIPVWILVATVVLALLSLVLEWTIPAYGTKVFEGSKYGVRGAYIGMVVGIFLPIPLAFLIGPFVGSYLGELHFESKDHGRALKAAFGTFMGFVLAILLNFLMVSLMALVWGYYSFRWFF